LLLARIISRRTFQLAAAAIALATALGCTVDVGRLPVVSTRPVVAADLVRPASRGHRTEGRSCVWIAVAVPIGPLPSLADAVDEALERASAAALWDARVRYELVYVPFVGRGCYVVEGDVPGDVP
jgi:hypothetical protein